MPFAHSDVDLTKFVPIHKDSTTALSKFLPNQLKNTEVMQIFHFKEVGRLGGRPVDMLESL